MKKLCNFYDKLFLQFYDLKKKSDNTAQYFPIIIISTTQALNLFFMVILIFYFLGIKFSLLPIFFLFITAATLLFNFYLYQIRDRKKIVLRKKLRLSFWFKTFSFFYILVSLAAPPFLIHFFNEYLINS